MVESTFKKERARKMAILSRLRALLLVEARGLKKEKAFQLLLLRCENGCISRYFTILLLAASSGFWQLLVQISGKQVVGIALFYVKN